MTWRNGSWAVLVVLATACGGTSNVELPDGGPGPDATSPPDGGNPTDAGPPSDGPLPPVDGAGPEGGNVDSGAFSPTNLKGLALWLDAEHKTALDGNGRLQTWGDLSGNANDASQATSTSRPGLLSQAINNLPAVHFEGVSSGPYLSVADSSTMQWGTGDFLVALVARFSNNPTSGLTTGAGDFFWKSTFNGTNGAGVGFLANIPTANYTVATGLALSINSTNYVFTQTAYNDGAGRLYLTRRIGTKLELRVNASSVATQTGTATDVSASGTPALIGAIGNGVYYRLAGDISEMIAVKGPISDPDLTSLEAYLKGKYGL